MAKMIKIVFFFLNLFYYIIIILIAGHLCFNAEVFRYIIIIFI